MPGAKDQCRHEQCAFFRLWVFHLSATLAHSVALFEVWMLEMWWAGAVLVVLAVAPVRIAARAVAKSAAYTGAGAAIAGLGRQYW